MQQVIDQRRRVAAAVKDYLARRHISRDEFAFRTKLGKSTVDKLLVGMFSERTLAIVEDHTQLELRPLLVDRTSAPAPSAPGPGSTRPSSQPSIAVLPFENLGGDPRHDFLADGITEEITTALARLRWLFVVARTSTSAYRGRAADVREVGRELDVRYVLEGSVRAAGDRLRVTGQLVDAQTGKHIWAERYDREFSDLFAVQDDITAHVVAAVEPHLYAEEGTRAALTPPDSIDAWTLVVRALDLMHRLDRSRTEEARALLCRAIELDPNYARAHALLGWASYWSAFCDWTDRPGGIREATAHAETAISLDAGDPWARMILGLARSNAGQHDRALDDLRAALALNPNFALGHTAYGWALVRVGRFEEAIGETGYALKLSPLDTFSGLYTTIHGLALLATRRFEEALPFLRTSVGAFTGYSGAYNTLISCCGHLGLLDEARELTVVRARVTPPLRVADIRRNLASFAHCEVFVEGLVKAGVPE